MSAGDTFIRIIPSLLLFIMLIWCCCKGEQPHSTNESPESREERRRRIESSLIVKKVVAAPKRRSQRLTQSDRAYSSYLSAVRLPSKEPVVFSEANILQDVSVQHAEEGTAAMEEETKEEAQHHNVHFSNSTIPEAKEEETLADVVEEATAAFQAAKQKQGDSLKISNRTDVSWAPSASSSSLQSNDVPPTTSTANAPLVRRKSNIIARTISMSLRSLSMNSNAPYSSCDICLMDYQVGEEVCWSPNEECLHAFHKDCMMDWLLRNPLCPVCRRDYLAKTSEQQQQQHHDEA